jgi:hypothetical protein
MFDPGQGLAWGRRVELEARQTRPCSYVYLIDKPGQCSTCLYHYRLRDSIIRGSTSLFRYHQSPSLEDIA